MNARFPSFCFTVLGCLLLASGVRAADRTQARSTSDAMVSCLHTCGDPECLRTCIGNEPLPISSARRTIRPDAQTSIADCAGDALINVSTCSRVFLTPVESADYEAFWHCTSVAAQVFTQCPAFVASSDAPTSVETMTKLGALALDLLLDAAERDVRVARSGVPPVGLRDIQAHLRGGEDVGEAAAVGEGSEKPPKSAPPTFRECAIEFSENRGVCLELFDGDLKGLSDCYDVAKKAFEKCVGVLKK